MRQFDAFGISSRTGRVNDGENFICRGRGVRRVIPSPPRGEQNLELKDAVIVPEILLTHSNEEQELRKLNQQLLEDLKEVEVFHGFRGNRRHCL